MIRRRGFLVWAALLTGCAGAGPAAEEPPAPADVTAVSTPVATTSAAATTTSPVTPTIAPQLQPAPDFSLLLGDGTTFTRSRESRPIFMVFWAEW